MVKYPVNWQKVSEATKVTLIPESNLDRSDEESLMFDEHTKPNNDESSNNRSKVPERD